MNKNMKKLFLIVLLLLVLTVGILFFTGKLNEISLVIYGCLFGGMTSFNAKRFETKNKHLEAIKGSKKSLQDALALADNIQNSRDKQVKELVKNVENAKKKVDAMSADELVDWGNKFLEAKRRGKAAG